MAAAKPAMSPMMPSAERDDGAGAFEPVGEEVVVDGLEGVHGLVGFGGVEDADGAVVAGGFEAGLRARGVRVGDVGVDDEGAACVGRGGAGDGAELVEGAVLDGDVVGAVGKRDGERRHGGCLLLCAAFEFGEGVSGIIGQRARIVHFGRFIIQCGAMEGGRAAF